MKQWIEPTPVFVPDELRHVVGGHPLVAETLVRRGFSQVDQAIAFLNPEHYYPAAANELPGIDRSVERLSLAIQRGEHIGVWGDFDVDGQTATSMLVSALRDLGAQVSFHIPVRARESHGIGLPALKEFLSTGVQVLLSCDTGIAGHAATSYAQKQGVDVLITDHHELPPELPQAFSITNPRLLPEGHPLAALPGAGVAYKLVEALYESYQRHADARANLDLVALGIVADVASLQGDTRYLLQRGLQALRITERTGLKAIFEAAELDPHWLSEEHIGFSIGPRLNAVGRLGDANPMVELLTTTHPGRAAALAQELEAYNDRRKLLTNQVFHGALAQVQANPDLLHEPALVLSNPHWPAGVIGIVASRLVERYGKPVILMACPPGEAARGSARSTTSVHITQAIGAVAAANPGLIHGFGGHAAAAGLSMEAERIPELQRLLARAINQLFPEQPERALYIDGSLPFRQLSLDLVADLERLAPFGAGNPALTLVERGMRVVNTTGIGRGGEHLQLIVEDETGWQQRVLWWQGAVEMAAGSLPEGTFDLAYSVRASSFGGQRQVQVEFVDWRAIPDQAIEVQLKPAIKVQDYRQAVYPYPILDGLRTEGDVLVWAEAEAARKLPGKPRQELENCPRLAIWTIPPGRRELQAALTATNAQEVILFAADPDLDQPEKFLARLGGLIKHLFSTRQGSTSLVELAGAMAHREATVRKGLTWLAGRGHIHFQEENGQVLLSEGTGAADGEQEKAALKELKALLEETSAFRDYYRQANPESLLRLDPPEKKGRRGARDAQKAERGTAREA